MKTVSRNNLIEAQDVEGYFDLYRVDTQGTYSVSVFIGRGWGAVHAGDFRFDNAPRNGVTRMAREAAERTLASVLAQAEREYVYVVIDDMPGFAEERLGKHEQAGYRGQPVHPRYVVRCADSIEADQIVARVEAIGTIVDGGRSFSPQVVDMTNHALEALDGSLFSATDAVTLIQARRADNATVNV